MILYNILAFFILVFSMFLFSRAAGSIAINKINTTSFLIYRDIIPVVFIGSLLIANNLVDNHYVVQVLSDDIKIRGLLFALYSMIALPLGMIMVNKYFKLNITRKYDLYIKSDIVDSFTYPTIKVISLFLTVISFITLGYILFYSPSIPIISAIKGDILTASIQRRENKVNFGGIIYIKNILGYYFMPIMAYYMYILKYRYNTFYFKFLFSVNLILVSILLLYDTQKAPIIYFIIGFLIVHTLIKGKIKIIYLIFFSILAFVGIVLLYIVNAGAELENLLKTDSVIMYRLFIGQIAGYFLSLEWFPNLISENTALSGIPTFILQIFGVENIESARLLMMYFNPEGVATGNAGLMSSYFMGEAWANYGYAGLILSPFIVGMVIQLVHVWLLTNKKDAFNIALYAVVTTKWVITGGFVGFLYLKVLIIPALLYLFYKVLVSFIIKLR